ncbi:MAG TPA: MFS transporter [candidate division Zixibacteria bacterium]
MEKNEATKTIRTFALASFLNDMGSDMIYPIWPLFVTTVLGANMTILGLIDGLGEAVVSISQAVSGYLSDRIRKRKIFIWSGYLCAFLSRIGYAISTTWQYLIPFKILDRAGKIRAAPRDAIVADVCTRENRCEKFGLLGAMDSLGAVCGIVICILFYRLLGYTNLFLIAAIPSAIGAILILSLIKERKPTDVKTYRGMSLKDVDANLKLFFLLSSIFAFGSFSYSFLLIYAKHFGFGVTFVPVLYLVFTAVASIVSLPVGKLSDKIGRKPLLVLSFVLWGLVCLSFILLQSHLVVIVTFVLYGLHKGSLDPVQKTLVSELSPTQFRASTLGGLKMVTGICALPASLIAGLLWDKIGIFAPFYFSLGLTSLSVVMLLFVKEK